MNPFTATTPEEHELVDLINDTMGADWYDQEGFESWAWATDPQSPGHRPILCIDDDITFSTFTDGTLGFTTPAPGGAVILRAFRGKSADGSTVWESIVTPLGSPALN